MLTIRIPPATDGTGPDPADYPVGTEVTLAGEVSWVLAVRPVYWHGAVAYLELTTGEQAPAQLAASSSPSSGTTPPASTAEATHPATDETFDTAVFVTGATGEPVDDSQSTVTTGTLYLPTTTVVASTDSATITVPQALAGSWQVDGDPQLEPSRLEVPLRRM